MKNNYKNLSKLLTNNKSRQVETDNGIVRIDIDTNSGFCFGVVNAIQLVEDELKASKQLLSLGHIVHNEEEVDRLNEVGLTSVNYQEFENISNGKILFRAHGEPPKSYEIAKDNKIEIIDATCPVVLKLQQRIKKAWEESKTINSQVVIFGKQGHAEVIGLLGQTNNEAIIIEKEEDLYKLNQDKLAIVFSQTTMSVEKYLIIGEKIEEYLSKPVKIYDTICRQVANRAPKLKEFVQQYDLIVFVGGTKSSNAKYLFSVCKEHNPSSIFISSTKELNGELFIRKERIGICGATSTPMWLMENVAEQIETIIMKINKR